VYLADHSESPNDGQSWPRALTHALGPKDWWDAHYRKSTTADAGASPLGPEVMRRTLGAYAAVSFTAIAEMHRQQVEWSLFGEVTRPKAPSPEWAALAAIGQEVRSAVVEGRCPDDTEAFNAWSVVSFYVMTTFAVVHDGGDSAPDRRVRRRDLAVFSSARRLDEQPVDRTAPDAAPALPGASGSADDLVAAQFTASRWTWARRKLRLRGA
jgi:hypothetical protein